MSKRPCAAPVPTSDECTWCGQQSASSVDWERRLPAVPGVLKLDESRFHSWDCLYSHCCVRAPSARALHLAVRQLAGRTLLYVPPKPAPVSMTVVDAPAEQSWVCTTFDDEPEEQNQVDRELNKPYHFVTS
jgi:hypothetical protein